MKNNGDMRGTLKLILSMASSLEEMLVFPVSSLNDENLAESLCHRCTANGDKVFIYGKIDSADGCWINSNLTGIENIRYHEFSVRLEENATKDDYPIGSVYAVFGTLKAKASSNSQKGYYIQLDSKINLFISKE